MYKIQFIISSSETTQQNFHISSSVSLLLYQVSDLKTQINHEALQPSYHDRCSNLLLVRGFMLYIVILVILSLSNKKKKKKPFIRIRITNVRSLPLFNDLLQRTPHHVLFFLPQCVLLILVWFNWV